MPHPFPFPPPVLKMLLCVFAICIAGAQAGAKEGAHQDNESPIELNNPPAQWQALFNALGSHPRIESQFTEKRFFPFRKFPKRLRGTMYFDESKGIALHYQSPGNYIVFAQPDGIYIRSDGDSEPSEIPAHASSAAMLGILPDLMRFAPQKLAERFSATGLIAPDGKWQITLTRLSPRHLPGLQEIRLQGDAEQLKTLVLVRGVQERSEIDIERTSFPAADAPDPLPWPHPARQAAQ